MQEAVQGVDVIAMADGVVRTVSGGIADRVNTAIIQRGKQIVARRFELDFE